MKLSTWKSFLLGKRASHASCIFWLSSAFFPHRLITWDVGSRVNDGVFVPELQLHSSPVQEDGGRLVVDSWKTAEGKIQIKPTSSSFRSNVPNISNMHHKQWRSEPVWRPGPSKWASENRSVPMPSPIYAGMTSGHWCLWCRPPTTMPPWATAHVARIKNRYCPHLRFLALMCLWLPCTQLNINACIIADIM